jgi:hypothetical protein
LFVAAEAMRRIAVECALGWLRPYLRSANIGRDGPSEL